MENIGYRGLWRLIGELADGTLAPSDAFARGIGTKNIKQQEEIWQRTVRDVVQANLPPGYAID